MNLPINMKKFILLTLCLSLSVATTIHAEDQIANDSRHYIDLQIGDPILSGLLSQDFYYPESYYDIPYADRWTGHYNPTYLKSFYLLPSISASYHYAILPWLQLGGTFNFYCSGDTYNDYMNDHYAYRITSSNIALLFDVRFRWFRRPVAGLYSSLAAGIDIVDHAKNGQHQNHILPMGQLTFIGLQLGRQVYWNVELGVGVEGFFKTGIGYRF